MSNASPVSLIAGMLLGAVFFGGLWWTVRRGVASRTPALWFIASPVLRTAVALSGFYCVASGDWRNVLGCTTGFLVSRTLIIFLHRPIGKRMRRATGAAA